MATRAAIYARISKDRAGAGLGVDRQRIDCRELAERLGWQVVAEHTDNDLSAYSGKPRPGYRALLADVAEAHVDAVLAWHSDRLHRSPVELEEYISTCEARSVPTHCVKAGPLDLSTPSGRLVARQLGAVARYEVEHAIERAKRAKLQAAQDGRFRGGRRAFGYESDGVTVRESEAVVVAEVADRLLAGESSRATAAALNERGLTGSRGAPWTGASLRDAVLKARNAGLIEHEGQIVGPAKWPAILPMATWEALNALLRAPGRAPARSTARRYLGSGLFLCGRCGAAVRIGSAGTRKKHARPYYRCSGTAMHFTRVAYAVDTLVADVITARLGLPDAAELVAAATGTDDPTALHTERTAVRLRLDELTSMFARGQIDARQLASGSDEARRTLDDLDRRIGDAYRGSALAGIVGEDDVAARWEAAGLDRRRAIVDALATVTILPSTAGRKPGGHYFDPASVEIVWRLG